MQLCGMSAFDVDVTYGNGSFWKRHPAPTFKFDIDPQQDDVVPADSGALPLKDSSVASVMFDPPFLTYIKQGRGHNSVMGKRYSGYWSYDQLAAHYTGTISEAHRILQPKGIFVIKCQDIIHNHRMHATHINVVKWAEGKFRLKDLFVLAAKNRMPMPETEGAKKRVQKHARVHHSYFMVMEKLA